MKGADPRDVSGFEGFYEIRVIRDAGNLDIDQRGGIQGEGKEVASCGNFQMEGRAFVLATCGEEEREGDEVAPKG